MKTLKESKILMKNSNINPVLKEVLSSVKPTKEDSKEIKKALEEFLEKLDKKIKTLKLDAEIFVGGSYAKGTMIKKDHYDIDVFLRFDKKYKDDELSKLAYRILEKSGVFELIHGSRDYFKVNAGPSLCFEVIPVRRISKAEEALNVTDLSYAHVKYINKKIKNKNILDEIRIAKAFCHANNCYGAESYIGGFSGYALELLIIYCKGFMNFLKAMKKISFKDKLIVDIEKHYKNKHQIMLDINSSKLQSPIILIDPTYKKRNALAALSDETFEKFRKEAINFIKNPSIKAFEQKKTDLNRIKSSAAKKKQDFILIEAETNKQPGDIAGSKLLKFYRHFEFEISAFFEVKNKGFNYNRKKNARFFFVAKPKDKIIMEGPKASDKENMLKFQKKHNNIFTSKGRIYARERVDYGMKKFVENWKNNNQRKIKEMYITKLRIVDD